MIVAGIGFRQECSAEEIAVLITTALARANLPEANLVAMPGWKTGRDDTGRNAANNLGLPLRAVAEAALAAAAPHCPTPAKKPMPGSGMASAAEAAALAAAGPGATLRLARIQSTNATCALAEGPGAPQDSFL
ncbi:cobalamin biosynthesis protein [Radicibacter daui]|uniref:cobalamin biosynthesis protein n=1 Tax=Radicibacter daui TaxID=3064829 RepID=UPI004046C2BA